MPEYAKEMMVSNWKYMIKYKQAQSPKNSETADLDK